MRVTHSQPSAWGCGKTRSSYVCVSEHGSDQQVKSDRPDAKTVVPTTDSEQELPPAHTRAIQRQRTRLGRPQAQGYMIQTRLADMC